MGGKSDDVFGKRGQHSPFALCASEPLHLRSLSPQAHVPERWTIVACPGIITCHHSLIWALLLWIFHYNFVVIISAHHKGEERVKPTCQSDLASSLSIRRPVEQSRAPSLQHPPAGPRPPFSRPELALHLRWLAQLAIDAAVLMWVVASRSTAQRGRPIQNGAKEVSIVARILHVLSASPFTSHAYLDPI